MIANLDAHFFTRTGRHTLNIIFWKLILEDRDSRRTTNQIGVALHDNTCQID